MSKLEDRLKAAAEVTRAEPTRAEAPLRAPVEGANIAKRRGSFEQRMQRWTGYVDRNVLYRMHAFSESTGIARSTIVTEALAQWLDEHGAP